VYREAMTHSNGQATQQEKRKGERPAHDIVAKVTKLMALAQSEEDGEMTEEATNAAVKAVQLMNKHELVVVLRSDVERAKAFVEGAQTLVQNKVKQESFKNMGIGFVVGMFLSKGGLKF
jgi:ElaB/YqjD/DUF883 family membrane-anchored ribosome-binding protein